MNLLTTTQAAARLGITPQAVTLIARAGEFRGAVQPWGPGRGWLIPEAAVAARERARKAGKIPKGGRPKGQK